MAARAGRWAAERRVVQVFRVVVLVAALSLVAAGPSGAQSPPPNTLCNNPGTCGNLQSCNATDPDCGGWGVCATLAEGGGLCVNGATQCAGLQACSTSAECPAGEFCTRDSCCGPGVCIPVDALCAGESVPTPAPVLSLWGIIAVVAMLVGLGLVAFRRRASAN